MFSPIMAADWDPDHSSPVTLVWPFFNSYPFVQILLW
jgi:hypothetical protein